MKALLAAIKSTLQTQIESVRDRDIFVTEDENIIPYSIGFPAIGLKDGSVSRKRVATDLWQTTRQVLVIPVVRLSKPEEAVMGGVGTTGILDLAAAIREALDDNLLGIGGMQDAECYSEQPSALFGDEKEALQRKILTYTYMQDEA
ncbi:hypothetical protein DSCO28_50430 [Desulfosarcina ovata subsp. sediminis]|uniref:DUF3168 domain-containing protein n=1 Tax=Desulfosarcina ovata subsp. sediminis TaxID=885957 RepID=A0A5K7ZW44_9BACT|nr:hypothetical protein [Desulfosarcina ovata]BBO80171.1 hypothetical protein DSCO28_07370 [Desulfosarcina ovata subsp. sediminis]BBO84477.1 hypothetical protein DSCO28_50430 [Desulfosarcina ovata subsp. sediminis]